MKPSEYLKNAEKTDHKDYAHVVLRVDDDLSRLIHYAIGLATETAEIQDILKKRLAYGKPLDLVNLKEELGDLMWYVARICSHQGWALEEVMELNIKKLHARFGEKFSEDGALNRNLEKERKILNKG